jgi:hypothetical protein
LAVSRYDALRILGKVWRAVALVIEGEIATALFQEAKRRGELEQAEAGGCTCTACVEERAKGMVS